MKRLSERLINFLFRQSFTVISTVDKNGLPHNSCKGIVKIDKAGRIYLLDLYKGRTVANLRRRPNIALTVVDEHKFKGFCLKGRARIIRAGKLDAQLVKAWERKIIQRVAQRVLKNMRGEKGHPRHPEALFPKPEYMIMMQVEEIVDLTPQHLKGE